MASHGLLATNPDLKGNNLSIYLQKFMNQLIRDVELANLK